MQPKISGYPPHFWIEPYREVMSRVCLNLFGVSLVLGLDDRYIAAARELAKQGYLRQDGGPFTAAGRTYIRFVPTDRVKVSELKHGY